VGDWGAESEQMVKYKKVVLDYIKTLPADEQFEIDADDGTFLMHYDDWKDIFSTLFINNDFPEDWSGIRFKSAWTSSNAAGLPTTYTKDALSRYAENPQFLFKSKEDCEVVASLHQDGGRLPENGKYFDYPFAETLDYNCLAVFRLDFGERLLKEFSRQKIVYLSPIKREVDNSGRFKLKGGETYIIVPSNELPGVTGQFYLSIYVNKPYRELEVKRVFAPSDRNTAKDEHLPYFIPEEMEKATSTPAWELELVRESLDYVMQDDDNQAMSSDQ